MYLVYVLKCENKSYVGMTNDFCRRLRQHNGELKGGARYTTKFRPPEKDWYPICIIDGFDTMKEAMQCEWRVKRQRGYVKRLRGIHEMLQSQGQWTKSSPKISEQRLHVYVDDEYRHLFTDISYRQLYWKE